MTIGVARAASRRQSGDVVRTRSAPSACQETLVARSSPGPAAMRQAKVTLAADVGWPASRCRRASMDVVCRAFIFTEACSETVPQGAAQYHRGVSLVLASASPRRRELLEAAGISFIVAPAHIDETRRMPHVIVAAANHKGEIVRYYESHETTPYYGSPHARDGETGVYRAGREARMIASVGKTLVAIGIANEHRDTIDSLYLDSDAPAAGLETCARGGGHRFGRRALVTFACSLNTPLLNRAAQLGQLRVKALIDGFGFNMPPVDANGEGTPPSTAAVLGQIAGSPRRVHHMAGVVLAAMLEQHGKPVRPPSLVKLYDFTAKQHADAFARDSSGDIVPSKLIRRDAVPMLKALHGPFADVRFCPTGGVTPETASHYLALPNVPVCGGTWLTPADAMEAGDWPRITRLAQAAARLRSGT